MSQIWIGNSHWNCQMTRQWLAVSHKSWQSRHKPPSMDYNGNVSTLDARILLNHWRGLVYTKKTYCCQLVYHHRADESSGQPLISRRIINTAAFSLGDMCTDDSSWTFHTDRMHADFTAPKTTVSKITKKKKITKWNKKLNPPRLSVAPTIVLY